MQREQVDLGAVEQDRDVPGRDAERLRDVFARHVVEHAQRDHRALDVRQRLHAAVQADPILGGGDQLVGAGRGGGQRRDQLRIAGVGLGVRVQPAAVARHVARQRDQQAARLVAGVDQRMRRGQGEERLERVLDGVERVLGGQPLGARDARQLAPVPMDQLADPAEKRAAVRVGAGAPELAPRGGLGRGRTTLGFREPCG